MNIDSGSSRLLTCVHCDIEVKWWFRSLFSARNQFCMCVYKEDKKLGEKYEYETNLASYFIQNYAACNLNDVWGTMTSFCKSIVYGSMKSRQWPFLSCVSVVKSYSVRELCTKRKLFLKLLIKELNATFFWISISPISVWFAQIWFHFDSKWADNMLWLNG